MQKAHSPSEDATTPLSEQIVLVTGGARGLGAAITRAFLDAGARVVVNYCESQQAAKTWWPRTRIRLLR